MTPIEEAQVRVAKAQEERDKLHMEILRKHGSISDIDRACSHANMCIKKDKDAVELRKSYHKATKELRLAKSDLARLRNEEGQKAELKRNLESSKLPMLQEAAQAIYAPPISEEAPGRPAYMDAMDQAAEKAEASRATSIVISDKGVSIDGRAPVPKEIVSAAIDVIKGRKKTVQHDLEGNRAKALLSGRIKIPPQRFELETPSWVLKGPKDAMLELVNSNQRPAVKAKVQKGLRAKKDAVINDGDFDLAVERFTDEIMRGIIHRLPEDE